MTLEALTFGRLVLPTTAGSDALTRARVVPGATVDITATLAAAVAERDRLQGAFDAEQATRQPSKRLIVPRWPGLPEPLDIENPPPWDVNQSSDDHLDTALSIAHWVAALCSRWSDIEEERLGRKLLRDLGGPGERPLPVVLAS